RVSEWMVPAAHYLESWGDARAYDGTLSIVQPLIAPLYDGKTLSEILSALLGEPTRTAYNLVREQWTSSGGTDASWREALGRGVVPNTAFQRGPSPSLAILPAS